MWGREEGRKEVRNNSIIIIYQINHLEFYQIIYLLEQLFLRIIRLYLSEYLLSKIII